MTTDSHPAPQRTALLKDLTLTSENIIVLCIIFMMSGLLFFSVGVERGKIVSLQKQAGQDAESTEPAVNDGDVVIAPAEGSGNSATVSNTVTGDLKSVADPLKEEKKQPVIVDGDLKYTIQVASFKQETSARKEASTLEKKGYQTLVLFKGGHSVVCVGKFPEKKDALQFSSRLKKQYNDFLIRKL